MSTNLGDRPLRFDLKLMLLFIVTVSIALMWWRTQERLEQSEAKIEAIHYATELQAKSPQSDGELLPPRVTSSEVTSPEEFVVALREIDDWYEFADRTADPFSRGPTADAAIPLLIDLLDDPLAKVRTRALSSLNKIKQKPEVVVPAVIPMLEDEDANVRWHAAFLFGQYGNEAIDAVPALTAQMNDDSSPIAAFSATMIREIDSQVPTEARLIELLSSSSVENRKRAIHDLAQHGSEAAADALVRRYRVEPDPVAKEALAKAIKTSDARLRANPGEESASSDLLP